MQYILNYSEAVENINKILETKPQAFISGDVFRKYEAEIIAKDLDLSCIYNKVLERFYFRKERYKILNAHETFIY